MRRRSAAPRPTTPCLPARAPQSSAFHWPQRVSRLFCPYECAPYACHNHPRLLPRSCASPLVIRSSPARATQAISNQSGRVTAVRPIQQPPPIPHRNPPCPAANFESAPKPRAGSCVREGPRLTWGTGDKKRRAAADVPQLTCAPRRPFGPSGPRTRCRGQSPRAAPTTCTLAACAPPCP